jgi:8-amino-7-oxononanoate synthase
MDLFEKCDGFYNSDALAQSLGYPVSPHTAQMMGLYPYFIALDQTEGTEVCIKDKRLIMIGSNNYLGLTTHPKVREAAIQAIRDYGTSCTGSRFLNGTLRLHHELEEKLADYIGMEKALVFSTGYQTNLGTIPALIGRQDTVIIDKEDHASIVDGCRMALGTLKRFRHNDVADLERVLQSCPDDTGKLVIVDGVFSMGGEIVPLPEIVPVCKKYGARLMVDDAHSLGVLGGGRGTMAHFGMTSKDVDLVMGTFSKSFASIGGVIAGSEAVIHWIQHFARSLMFSASLPAPNVASVLAALEVMKAEPERVQRVNDIAERMRQGYRSLGYKIGNSQTPIIPIIIGDQMKTIMLWKALLEAGVYTNVALPPAVPEDMSLLRTSYMATHTDEQMDRVLSIFAKVSRELGVTA